MVVLSVYLIFGLWGCSEDPIEAQPNQADAVAPEQDVAPPELERPDSQNSNGKVKSTIVVRSTAVNLLKKISRSGSSARIATSLTLERQVRVSVLRIPMTRVCRLSLSQTSRAKVACSATMGHAMMTIQAAI